MIAKILTLAVTIILLTACNSTQPTVKGVSSVGATTSPAELNANTSTAIETKYMCEIATTNGLKPKPGQMDYFRMDPGGVGYVDLYGDGIIDVVSGLSDAMFDASRFNSPEEVAEWFAGNKERSTQATQALFFSPDPNFVVPEAKVDHSRNILPGDLNGDGIDDLVFFSMKRDFDHKINPNSGKAYNSVFLSGPNGYEIKALPGDKEFWHGGSIGDIDNDGDLDIVATTWSVGPLGYINDGKGNFKAKYIFGNSHPRSKQYVSVTLWDIDKDGILDMVGAQDGHYHPATNSIHWGKGNGKFESRPTVLNPNYKKEGYELISDNVFADLDGDGTEEIISLASYDSLGEKYSYHGYRVFVTKLNGRKVSKRTVIDDVAGKNSWFPYIGACDLKNDGDMDLVIERNGEMHTPRDARNADKIVYENDNGTFTKVMLAQTDIYENMTDTQRSEVIAEAERLGVAWEGYVPVQVYYPTSDGKRKGKTVADRPLRHLVKGTPVQFH